LHSVLLNTIMVDKAQVPLELIAEALSVISLPRT
jgi:hypothetical protein